jgi:acetyl-CoA/propionyl-CoA carboxylase biotin carboxyl carrier protein
VVGTRYDPLLAKILAHGASREEALTRLADTVSRTRVLGVTTNRGFLRWILDRPEIRSGDIRTDTVEAIWAGDGGDELTRRAFQAAAATIAQRAPDPWRAATGFRLNAPRRVRIRIGQDQDTADAVGAESGMAVDPPGSGVVVDLDGRAYRAELAPAPTVDAAVSHALRERGAVAAVVASMPGTVLDVRVAGGQVVEAGETLVVLEAMKMENAVTAPAAASVARVLVSRGDQVQRGDPLVELD